ncbi:MAG: DUF3048 domain-containing protein [Anaerolinea sp.]|nr:DUF3048 domain-containing protein [Anaerolinea sp.]
MRALIRLFALLLLIVGGQATAAQTDLYPDDINPLTGLVASQPDLLNRRPLIVKIDNYPPDIRPQSGLNAADMVWETLLAGGATRFGAIYLGADDEHIGPVRSCRLVDFELAHIFHSLFLCSGMAQGALDALRADPVALSRSVARGGPCPPLCRFEREGVAFEHTLFADTAGVRALAAEMGRDLTPEAISGMTFDAAGPAGTPISGLRIQYTATEVEWQWDAATGRWLRWQDGAAHMDALDGQQLHADNVLIFEADHLEQPVVSDGYWGPPNYAFTVDFTGSGRVILLRDGQFVEGEWRRATDADPLTYVDLNGNPLDFKPGKTFVNLMPRWADGYQLVFGLTQPLTATVTFSGGINLRRGPAQGYSWIAAGQGGEQFSAVGRNRRGDWVQLLLPNGDPVWAAAELLNVDGDVLSLPLVRSTFE